MFATPHWNLNVLYLWSNSHFNEYICLTKWFHLNAPKYIVYIHLELDKCVHFQRRCPSLCCTLYRWMLYRLITGFVRWWVTLSAERSCWQGCPALAEIYGYKLQGLMGNCVHCRAFRRGLTRGNDDYDHAGQLDTLSKHRHSHTTQTCSKVFEVFDSHG